MKMYLTTTGQYARTKDEAGRGHSAVEVPTDARGLVAYLNGLLEHQDSTSVLGPPRVVKAPESPVQFEPDADGPQIAPEFVEKLYEPRTAFTQAQVDGMFSQTPPRLRELAYQIAKLPVDELGFIAFEVGHAFTRRGFRA